MTPVRHIQRLISKRGNEMIQGKPSFPEVQKDDIYVMPDLPEHYRDYSLEVSIPSTLVLPLRITWGPHTIFKISQERVDIDDFLPEELQAYPQENPSFMTRIKRDILFNPLVVGGINSLLQKQFVGFSGKSEADLHTLFETSTEERPVKYNIVSSLSGNMLMKNDIQNTSVDWILTKHVLISNYNESVRFAGEIWKDREGVIWVNRNSGTYQPSEEQLLQFVAYLSQVFPHVIFRADVRI